MAYFKKIFPEYSSNRISFAAIEKSATNCTQAPKRNEKKRKIEMATVSKEAVACNVSTNQLYWDRCIHIIHFIHVLPMSAANLLIYWSGREREDDLCIFNFSSKSRYKASQREREREKKNIIFTLNNLICWRILLWISMCTIVQWTCVRLKQCAFSRMCSPSSVFCKCNIWIHDR